MNALFAAITIACVLALIALPILAGVLAGSLFAPRRKR